jgi:hypothetical protein
MKQLPPLLLLPLLLAPTHPLPAALLQSDFLAPNDGFIVLDTVTNPAWLTPFYTRGEAYNSVAVQARVATHNSRYTTAAETID